ncbi:hypothetical protein OG552_10575 [Streptomyces sp. NBC_01476]|uniref:hypothetical protein n=1 Tax=Streptomyces sp. NBC_01476 TaxID=2903881 RepID=UPI002E314771|nr:hypothetical protein [Streptomyces sp. NBC_01476]
MHYGSGLARTGGLAIVIGGVTFTPFWQIAIAIGTVLAGGLALRAAHLIRHR